MVNDGSNFTPANNDGNRVGTPAGPLDPKLRPLDYYGGPTQTLALLGDSPAIGFGSNPLHLTTDQRGFGRERGVNGDTDIGAFEFGGAPPTPPAPPGPPGPHTPSPGASPFDPVTVRLVKVHRRTRLDVFDGLTGAFKGSLFPFGAFRGPVQVLTADVNGDGIADVIVLAVMNGHLRMRLFNGLNLAPL